MAEGRNVLGILELNAGRRRLLVLYLAVAAALGGCATTGTTSRPTYMRLGAAAFAPLGYLEFCTRRPDQCQTPARQIAANDAAPAARTAPAGDVHPRLTAAAADRPAPALAHTPALLVSALPMPGDLGDGWPLSPTLRSPFLDGAFLRTASWSPEPESLLAKTSTDFGLNLNLLPGGPLETGAIGPIDEPAAPAPAPAAEAQAAAPPLSRPGALHASADLMALLNQTNQRINAAIKPVSDLKTHGVADYWDLPLDAGGVRTGDCEDYALQKREALLRLGVPAEVLSIAVARTGSGENHAVLIVTTDSGELVLDNLTPWVTPWRQLRYSWIERQTPGGGPTDWVSLEDNNGAA
jgi:predicted transglutaminase-like cysteine proteinase